MIEVALTGNRYTGKDFIAKKFRKINVPVFDGDTVLKFIINHRFSFLDSLKRNWVRTL